MNDQTSAADGHIRMRTADSTWVVRTGDGVIAESARAVELNEGRYDPVIYFPREDVAMAFLEPSDKTTHCPHKGDATYYSLEGQSGRIANAAWSYEAPFDDMTRIAGHLAFDGEQVTIERL